jgi:hypothetical protein
MRQRSGVSLPIKLGGPSVDAVGRESARVTSKEQRRSRAACVARSPFIFTLLGLLLASGGCGSISAVNADGAVDSAVSNDGRSKDTTNDAGNDGATDTDVTDNGGCVAQAVPDLPDDNFTDTNCDGIDGDVTRAVFVATSGADTNPGTMSMPMATINAAIAKAQATSRSAVYISSGVFEGRVTLVSGISLYGGYSQEAGWLRSNSYMTVISSTTTADASGRLTAVEGLDISVATTVDRLTIQAADAVSPSASSYAVHCVRCTALTLRNSILASGRGAPGGRAADGSPGVNGVNGTAGGAGVCDSSPPGAGGPGGAFACEGVDVSGGKAGGGGPAGANSGMIGVAGKNGGGSPGGGGTGGDPGTTGGRGATGSPASAGMPGFGGMLGMITAGFWIGMAGADGSAGGHGRGGGGGGGGGGQGCSICISGAGNGGGGGGSGGCGGKPGRGGMAGGGSFGLFLVDSSGFLLVACTISSSSGGDGGRGGDGGLGGTFGVGRAGGNACTAEVGAGGDGGNGSKGGDGGGGGGGGGGPSYAVYRSNTTIALTGNALTNGSGGLSGSGGLPGGGAGAAGPSGTAF